MPLQGKAKTAYQRNYMRRLRAGLPTRARPAAVAAEKPEPEKPKPYCWFCGEAGSGDRLLVGRGHPLDVHICEFCIAEAVKAVQVGRSSRAAR